MINLQSKRWIIAKGIAFLGIAFLAAALLLLESPSARTAVLLAFLVWAACRFYYFLFYVLERYVDPGLRYAGLTALVRTILAKYSKRVRSDVPATLSNQCQHQVRLERTRMRAWAWIPWLFVSGLFFSVLGLIPLIARFQEDGSLTSFKLIILIIFAFFTVQFGIAVGLWLWPFRPKPRIVPYFARQIEEYGGKTSAAFTRGRGLSREIDALDELAGTLGVRPLSAFGFADDYYDQAVQWHAAGEGLRTVDALRQGLSEELLAAPDVAHDLEALASVLRVAADRGVDFSMALRLRKDSLQVVSTRECRQGRFW